MNYIKVAAKNAFRRLVWEIPGVVLANHKLLDCLI